ncbi:MAG: transglutaminase domain-containing protein [Saprospiraceae bacterium]
MKDYLASTYYFDYHHPAIQQFVSATIKDAAALRTNVLRLYEAVRDGWYYDAYQLQTEKAQFRASQVVQRKRGHCIDKAVLLISIIKQNMIEHYPGMTAHFQVGDTWHLEE